MFSDWREKTEFTRIHPRFLWEYEYSKIDWYKMRHIVVSRIIERGWINDYYAAINLYGGMDNFKKIITEIPHLSDKDMDFVCKLFDLKKDNLLCYTKKQLREAHLNS